MKKTAIHIVAFILVILIGSSAWAQLGPSKPAIICDAPASVCATITDLGGGHKGLDVNGTFTGTITGTVNQGTAGSQSWRQWLYEPSGGHAMDYFLSADGKYSLQTYSLLTGFDYFAGHSHDRHDVTVRNYQSNGPTDEWGLLVIDPDIDLALESTTDLFNPSSCYCFGFMNFGYTPNPPTSIVTYTSNSENPIILDAHGAIHERLFDGSGNEFGVVGNPAYVVVNSITGSLPAGSAIIGKVTTDQTTPGTTDLVHAAQQGTWNIGSITTLPAITGTVTANQGGTWTVQPGNTANTTAWLVTGTGGTFPVTNSGLTNIDVTLSTRLKPADTLTGVTTVTSLTQMNGQAIAMGTGVRSAGTQRVTIATDDLVPVSAASLPLPTGAATSANQTNGNEITQVSTINRGTEQTATLSATGTFNFSPASSTSIDTSGYGYLLVNISTTGSPTVVQFSGTSDGGAATYFLQPSLMTQNSGGINYASGGNFYVVGIYKTWTLALTTLSGGSSPTVTVKATPVNAPMMPVTPTSVQANLNTGGNIAGKFGIDQTTDGTTNKVYVGNTPAITCALCALEAGGNLATLAGGVSSSIFQTNVKQINGVTPLMGNGVTGTGSPRVTIASDNTAFTVNAAQSGAWTVTANAGTNLNTSALALDSSVNGLLLSQESTTSGQKGTLALGAVTTANPSYTTAKSDPLSLLPEGSLRVAPVRGPETTAARTTAGSFGVLDMRGYSYAIVEVTGCSACIMAGYTGHANPPATTFSAYWVPSGNSVGGGGTGASTQSPAASNIYYVYGTYDYLDIQASTLVSGTVTVYATPMNGPIPETNPTSIPTTTVTQGTAANLQTLATQGTAAAATAPWPVYSSYLYSNLTTNATTTIKSGAGVLHSITINKKGIGNTAQIYDNTAGSGTTIGLIDTTLGQETLLYSLAFSTGLTIVTSGGTAPDITVTYR